MLLNGWNVTEEGAVWTGETREDPLGESHALMLVARRDCPPGAEQEGLFIKLLLDGELQTIFQMLNRYADMEPDEFARNKPAEAYVMELLGDLVESREDRQAALEDAR